VIDRRTFLGALAGGLVAAPLAAEGQQAGKVYRIGTISISPQDRAGHVIKAFEEALRELGYLEGQNVVFEHRFAGGSTEPLARLAAELVRLKVDVILVAPNPSVMAVKRATSTIPIVMTYGTEPVANGFATSFARPGGNVTGLTGDVISETWGIRLQLLRAIDPKMSRVAVIWNPDVGGAATAWQATEDAAKRFGISLRSHETRQPEEFAPAFDSIGKEAVNAILVFSDGVTYARRREIIEFAARRRLPTMFAFREAPDDGGLMSYGVNIAASYRRAATFVDKILKGAKPGDLPIEQPAKLELVINLKTAKAIGLTIPPSLLQRADEVIE
jgi:putative tryptophan/tyrosine transport system substrate-binding protein